MALTDNFTREELRTALQSVDEQGRGYRSFALCRGWTCIVLDPYDVSMIAYEHDKSDPR